MLHGQHVLLHRADAATIVAEVHPDNLPEFPKVAMDYFNSNISIVELHKNWAAIDQHMSKIC